MFNTDTIQKMSHDQISTIQAMGGAVAKGAQQITTEATDYSKKTMEQGSAVAEKMLGAKSLEALVQIQSEYMKTAMESFVAQSNKMTEIYAAIAKDAFKPVETAVAKVQGSL